MQQKSLRTASTVFFMVHVPRCAGTTIEHHFAAELGDKFCWAPRWNNPMRHLLGNRYPNLSVSDLAGTRVVSGHSLSTGLRRLLPDADIKETVLLRDPVGQLLSLYNLRMTRHIEDGAPAPGSFERWVKVQRRNMICRFLMSRYFEQGEVSLCQYSSAGRMRYLNDRLSKFHFVGSYKHAGELIRHVSEAVGVSPDFQRFGLTRGDAVERSDLSSDLVDWINQRNALDLELFQAWQDRKFSGAPEQSTQELPRFDQAGYVLGDIRAGMAKIGV